MPGLVTGQDLPAANGGIDIAWIELQRAAAPAGALGRDHRGAAAEKGVEHDLAARRAVEDSIGNHRHRLDRRVQGQEIALLAAAGEGISAGITPDIAAMTAKPTELDIVAVRTAALLKDQDELVLAAIERAHAGIVLDPDTQILEFAIGLLADGEQFGEMAPIHADVMQRAGGAKGGEVTAGLAEERSELGLIHLTRSHREWAVMDRAETARVTLDRHVVRWVGKDHRGALRAHQRGEGLGIEGITAQDAMSPRKPQISNFADWRRRRNRG